MILNRACVYTIVLLHLLCTISNMWMHSSSFKEARPTKVNRVLTLGWQKVEKGALENQMDGQFLSYAHARLGNSGVGAVVVECYAYMWVLGSCNNS